MSSWGLLIPFRGAEAIRICQCQRKAANSFSRTEASKAEIPSNLGQHRQPVSGLSCGTDILDVKGYEFL